MNFTYNDFHFTSSVWKYWMHNANLLTEKKALRQTMIVRRAAMAMEFPEASQQLCALFLENIPLTPNSVVSGYVAQKFEIDPAPLLGALRKTGHIISLPVVMGRGTNLQFRQHDEETPLVPGTMKILEPPETAATVIPDILLVPLLAFDRRGYRLGYGGGYYDRTLMTLRAQKPVLAIGVCYAGQEMPVVPSGMHDAPLDHIITHREFITPNL